MPVLHQEIDAVLFQRDGIGIVLRNALDHLHIGDVQFVAAGSALVGANLAFNNHARFLGQAFDGIEDFGGDRILGHDALNHAGAIAKLREQQLPALAQVVEPAANGDALALVLADFAIVVTGDDIVGFSNLVIE